jgi:hypothetical protein
MDQTIDLSPRRQCLTPDAPASLLNPDQGQYAVGSAGAPATVGTNTLSLINADLTRLSSTG